MTTSPTPVAPARGAEVVALSTALLIIAAVYLPVLAEPLVAEDYQLALKAARCAERAGELVRPFQLVWRPGIYALWAPLAGMNAPDGAFRAVQFGAGLLVTVAAWWCVRRLTGVGPWLAAAIAVVGVASPLASEPLCGEASFTGHLMFDAAFLAVLALSALPRSRQRAIALPALTLLAASFSEAWVVIPPLLLAIDRCLHDRRWHELARGAAVWALAVGAYLFAYGAVAGFHYGRFYGAGAGELAAKAAYTMAALAHVVPPLAWQFGAAVREAPLPVALGLAVVVLAAAAAWWLRVTPALVLLGGAVLTLLPTLDNAGQAGRWTLLPNVMVLAAAAATLRAALRRLPARRKLAIALAVLLAGVGVHDALEARRDVVDWGRLAALTARLQLEVAPLLAEVRAGRALMVLRGDDGAPWRDLVSTPQGQAKFYFPRPDDPYGIVSLSAFLTWRTCGEGLAVVRVSTLPSGGVRTFLHTLGGFTALGGVPPIEVRHPGSAGRGFPGVILAPVPWREFAPREFP